MDAGKPMPHQERALDLLREIRPTIPRDVLALWCKDRDAVIAALTGESCDCIGCEAGANQIAPFDEAEKPTVLSYRSEPGEENEPLMAVAQYLRAVRGFKADNLELHRAVNALDKKNTDLAEQRSAVQRQLNSILTLLGAADSNEAANKLGTLVDAAEKLNKLQIAWPDVYSAFKAAFDTPVARRHQSDEYAEDSRARMSALNSLLVAADEDMGEQLERAEIALLFGNAPEPEHVEQTSPTPVLGCDYRGKHFGAPYLDAQCQNGYLWDEDSCDEPGGPLLNGGDTPCPKCNAAEHAEYLRLDEDESTSLVPVGDIELARKLFEEMALIADDEKCIHMLAGALSKAQALAPRDDILSRMSELESVAKAGRPKKIVVRLMHPDSEPSGCSSLLNYHEPTRQQLITAGIPLSQHTRNPIVSFGMIGCNTTADGVIEYTWGESQEVLLDKSIPPVDMTRPAWLIPELKPDVVGALLLGGISGSEYGDNDLQVDSKAVERLQVERVTTEDDVAVELVTADQYKRDVAGLQARVDLFDRLAVANKALADSFQAERDTALASQAAQVRVISANWKFERTGERIIVQHLHNGAGYAASRAGESGIAESVLFLLASDLVGDGVVVQEDKA